MAALRDAGFVFWGLFVAFGTIVAVYVLWMRWAEREERDSGEGSGEGPGEGSGEAGPGERG